MSHVNLVKRKRERSLTSRPFVPLEGLDAGVGPSLEMAAGVSLVMVSLSNLTDKKQNTIQNVNSVINLNKTSLNVGGNFPTVAHAFHQR